MNAQEAPRVSDFMTPCPVTVEIGLLLVDALDRMYADNIRHLPVVDGNGKLVGLLSALVLLVWFARLAGYHPAYGKHGAVFKRPGQDT